MLTEATWSETDTEPDVTVWREACEHCALSAAFREETIDEETLIKRLREAKAEIFMTWLTIKERPYKLSCTGVVLGSCNPSLCGKWGRSWKLNCAIKLMHCFQLIMKWYENGQFDFFAQTFTSVLKVDQCLQMFHSFMREITKYVTSAINEQCSFFVNVIWNENRTHANRASSPKLKSRKSGTGGMGQHQRQLPLSPMTWVWSLGPT